MPQENKYRDTDKNLYDIPNVQVIENVNSTISNSSVSGNRIDIQFPKYDFEYKPNTLLFIRGRLTDITSVSSATVNLFFLNDVWDSSYNVTVPSAILQVTPFNDVSAQYLHFSAYNTRDIAFDGQNKKLGSSSNFYDLQIVLYIE